MNLPVLCRAAVFAGWMLDKEFSHDYTIDRRGADCKGQLSIPFIKKIDRTVWKQGGQSFLLSSLFIWENFAMTSTVRRITSTIKLSNARMNVSNARVSSRFIRYPSLRLQSSGQGTSKKVSSRNLCFVLSKMKRRCGTESLTTNFAVSALIISLSHFFTDYNTSAFPVTPVPSCFPPC